MFCLQVLPSNPPCLLRPPRWKSEPITQKVVSPVRRSTLFCFLPLQPRPTAELDRSGDRVYSGTMEMVKQVVQLKNDVKTLPASQYPNAVKVAPSLRVLECFKYLFMFLTASVDACRRWASVCAVWFRVWMRCCPLCTAPSPQRWVKVWTIRGQIVLWIVFSIRFLNTMLIFLNKKCVYNKNLHEFIYIFQLWSSHFSSYRTVKK